MNAIQRLALAAALAVAGAAQARATTIAPLSVEQMTDASTLVVRGVVEDVWTEENARGFASTRALVRVEEGWKGNADPGDYVTVESPGGVVGDLVTQVHLAARFSVGEECVLFLDPVRGGEVYAPVAMYAGKYTVRQNPADGGEMLVRFSVPYDRPYDARFIPHPPEGERLSADGFERRVRARAELGWDGSPIPGITEDRLRQINRLQPGVR